MVFSRLAQRMVSPAAAVMLVMGMVTVGIAVPAPSASAAGTVLFNQPFHDNTVDGPAGSVSLPTPGAGGSNFACLTAAGNKNKTGPLSTCSAPNDSQGSGTLRFTQAVTGQEGGVFASTSVPTSQGLDVTFNSYQYGGTGADGWRSCWPPSTRPTRSSPRPWGSPAAPSAIPPRTPTPTA